MWRKRNPLALMSVMRIYTITVENSIEIPKKKKKKKRKLGIELPYDPAISLFGIYPEKTRIERRACT